MDSEGVQSIMNMVVEVCGGRVSQHHRSAPGNKNERNQGHVEPSKAHPKHLPFTVRTNPPEAP